MNKKISDLTVAEVGTLALGYLLIVLGVLFVLSVESIVNAIFQ